MSKNRSEQLEVWKGPNYQELLDQDHQNIPAILRETRALDLGTTPVSASRYTSADFFTAEVKGVFLKTWQYACREEEIPSIGDSYVFDLVGHSIVVVRQRDGSIKALRNVCLHRGRKLLSHGGCTSQFRCPYHGFSWNIDGSFIKNAVLWDFPEIAPESFGLPQVRVEVWAGFVFVNFDSLARPLLELLEPLPRHFDHWRIQDCYKAAHVAKVAPANWKVVAEAFLENHHVAATHPQISPYTNDANAQNDVLSDHVGRTMSATGMPGIYDIDAPMAQEQIVKRMFANGSRAGREQTRLHEPGTSARRYAADISREALQTATGYDFSMSSDAEVIDAISYDFFPNFHLWGGFYSKICYRIRPLGLEHEKTLLEVLLFRLAAKGQPKPAPARLHMLQEDEKWASATELGYLAGVYDQDQGNFAPVQQGLRDLGEGVIHIGRYSEVRCRNLHRMIDEYIARDRAAPQGPPAAGRSSEKCATSIPE